MRVYLAGPIFGRTDEQAASWRTYAAALLADAGVESVDPFRRDYRGHEAENVAAIVDGDLTELHDCDAVLANFVDGTTGVGSVCEIVYAHLAGIEVVVAHPNPASPWLMYHADAICDTLESAILRVIEGAA